MRKPRKERKTALRASAFAMQKLRNDAGRYMKTLMNTFEKLDALDDPKAERYRQGASAIMRVRVELALCFETLYDLDEDDR